MENVSRETQEKLEGFAALLSKWNPTINLVSKSTIEDIWTRHIEDSLQLCDHIPKQQRVLDIGSGGGFPGAIIAIARPDLDITLMESDKRKSTFLRTAAIELGLSAKIVAERIEQAAPQNADYVTARALAPLDGLLAFAERHLRPGGINLFLKGENFAQEIEHACKKWTFDCQVTKSVTNPKAVILQVSNTARV